MAGFRVTVQGDEELLAGLRRMNPGLNVAITNKAMLESALAIVRRAAQRHIVRGGRKGSKPRAKILTSRSGRLRASLSQQGGGINQSGLPRKIEAGSNVVYAGVHEFGLGRMPKRPYLAPALEETIPEIPGIFLKHWNREIS